jgi:hypothetical protein
MSPPAPPNTPEPPRTSPLPAKLMPARPRRKPWRRTWFHLSAKVPFTKAWREEKAFARPSRKPWQRTCVLLLAKVPYTKGWRLRKAQEELAKPREAAGPRLAIKREQPVLYGSIAPTPIDHRQPNRGQPCCQRAPAIYSGEPCSRHAHRVPHESVEMVLEPIPGTFRTTSYGAVECLCLVPARAATRTQVTSSDKDGI